MSNEVEFDLNEVNQRMQNVIQSVIKEFKSLRTGRVTPTLLDPVKVEAYGQKMTLTQLATVSTLESRSLSISVWDQTMVKAVEKAILNSGLGLTPQTEGQVIWIRIPEMTEERRKEIVKVAHTYAEEGRIAIRHHRREAIDQVKKHRKLVSLGEDYEKRICHEIQKITDDNIQVLDKHLEEKEKEVLTL